MKYKEIMLVNPIDDSSINKLFEAIRDCECEFLLIDTGAHDFESISALKNLKQRFGTEDLSLVKKIAFLHPPEFGNFSLEPERYQYFTDKGKAIQWLNE